MPKISDEALERIASLTDYDTASQMASELLAAREVVEAVRSYTTEDDPMIYARLHQSLTAYDEATHD